MIKILITVGSLQMDYALPYIDKQLLQFKKKLDTKIVAQIGKGGYIPKSADTVFRYSPDIEKWYKWADIIISNPGAGTIFKLLELNKKVIAIKDALGPLEKGSLELPEKLAKDGYILLIDKKTQKKLKEHIINLLAGKVKLKRYTLPQCKIHTIIVDYLSKI